MTEQDWDLVGFGGRMVLAIVAAHGVTSAQWRRAHTLGVLVCILALAGRELRTA